MEVQCATGNVRPCEFNWYQLKLNCSVIQRILTGLPLKVNYHQLKSTGTCYTIPLKVIWFQLKMPFNWYQLKLVLRSGRMLTGLPLEVNYHQLKSTGTCYNQLVPVESQLVPVENAIQLVPVENAIQLVPVKTCSEIRENSYWSPVRSLLPPVEINWNLLQSTGSC